MSQFDKVIKEGYSFEMGKYFDEGWKYFSKGALHLIIFTLLFIIIYFIVSFVPFVNMGASFIIYPLAGGMFIYFRRQEKQNPEFGDLFSGFNYFGQIALYLLVLFLMFIPAFIIMFAFVFPFELFTEMISGNPYGMQDYSYQIAERMEDNFGFMIVAILIIAVYFIYISISYMFVIPLIIDAKLGFWEAMETSRKVVAKKFLVCFGFYLLLGLMFGFGVALTCGLGIFVMLPFAAGILFSAYNNIYQPNQDTLATQIADFGQSGGDINTEAEDDNQNKIE